MKRLLVLALPILVVACARLDPRSAPLPGTRAAEMWNEAHLALYAQNFTRADSFFTRLAADHPRSDAGREAVFYMGSLRIDPRNPGMDAAGAESHLLRYLQQDTVGSLIHRRPEATTLLEITRQLGLAPEDRIGAFRSPIMIAPATAARPPARPANPQELQEENERLRRQLAQRDEQIRRQQDELDRIRRTLAPRTQ